jgi:hypothetical protein
VDPVGFAPDLDGNVAAFGDQTVVNRGLREHGGAVSLLRAVRRTGAAYGPVPCRGRGRSDAGQGDGLRGMEGGQRNGRAAWCAGERSPSLVAATVPCRAAVSAGRRRSRVVYSTGPHSRRTTC